MGLNFFALYDLAAFPGNPPWLTSLGFIDTNGPKPALHTWKTRAAPP